MYIKCGQFFEFDYQSPPKLCQINEKGKSDKIFGYFQVIIAKVFFMIQHFVSKRRHLVSRIIEVNEVVKVINPNLT